MIKTVDDCYSGDNSALYQLGERELMFDKKIIAVCVEVILFADIIGSREPFIQVSAVFNAKRHAFVHYKVFLKDVFPEAFWVVRKNKVAFNPVRSYCVGAPGSFFIYGILCVGIVKDVVGYVGVAYMIEYVKVGFLSIYENVVLNVKIAAGISQATKSVLLKS